MEEEPYQISVSKYTESNNENYSVFYNSKMSKKENNINKNEYNNKYEKRLNNKDEQAFYPMEYKLKNSNENNRLNHNENTNININRNNSKNKILYNQKKKIPYKNKETNKKFSQQNISNNNLLLNNNNLNTNNNLPRKKNIRTVPHIAHNKSFSSNRYMLSDKINNNNFMGVTKNKPLKSNNNIYHTENNSNLYHNKLNKKNFTNRIHNTNISKIQNLDSFEYNIIKEDNFKKIYSKKQKAELDMVRGCFIYDKKYLNFDIKNGSTTINYIKFIKLTEPIIQINYRNIDKFYPLIRKKFSYESVKNDINDSNYNNMNVNKNNNIRKYQTFANKNHNQFANNFSPYELRNENNNYNNELMKKKSNMPFPKNEFPSNEDNGKNNKPNYTNNNNNISNYNQIDEYGLSYQFKKKIYDWLIDIDIIKDKVIKIEYLPTLCIN